MSQIQENKYGTIAIGIFTLLVSSFIFIHGYYDELAAWNRFGLFTVGGVVFMLGVGLIVFGFLGFKPESTKKGEK